MKDLSVETIFLVFIHIKSILAEEITRAIFDAMQKINPTFQYKKVFAQTYDGANNMQGKHGGVQAMVRRQKCYFALPNHCWNHQLQLGVKKGVKGHSLIENTLSYCEIIVKLYKYSPKRHKILMDIKVQLCDSLATCQFTIAVGKLLGLCVTRWTCRAKSLMNYFNTYFAQLKGFVTIMSDKELNKRLQTEQKNEIVGMLSKLQHFEFFYGLRLSAKVFEIVEKATVPMQQENLSASKGVRIVNKLLQELRNAKSDNEFDTLWDSVEDSRTTINGLIQQDAVCQAYGLIDEIESASAGRGAARVAIHDIAENVEEDENHAAKLYWKEFYVSAFEGIIADLERRLDSDLLKTLMEMETILVKLVEAENLDFSIESIEKNYGVGTDKDEAPFGAELTKDAIKDEMGLVCDEWIKLRNHETEWRKKHPDHIYPICGQDVIDMMIES